MKRTKPAARRKPATKYAIVGIEVPAPTRRQLAQLKKLFRAKAVATLGIAPTLVAQKQQYESKRRRGR